MHYYQCAFSVLFYCRTGDVRTPLYPFFRYPPAFPLPPHPLAGVSIQVQGPQLTSIRSGHHAGHTSYPPSAPRSGVIPLHSLVDSPVDKGCGAISPPLCVGLDSASPLRGHSDLDLHKLLHILSLCSFLRFCCARLFFAHFPSSFSGEPPILGAPFPACQHYSTKSNIRPDINRTNIRPHIC